MSRLHWRVSQRVPLIAFAIVAPLFALALESRAAPEAQVSNVPVISAYTPTCYQPEPEQNACYIDWQYIDVASDPSYSSYIVGITLTLDSRVRAYYAGFFQTVAYLADNQMRGPNLKVACGPRDADGWGNTYFWRISAHNSNNAASSVGDKVRCPGAILDFLPNIRR